MKNRRDDNNETVAFGIPEEDIFDRTLRKFLDVTKAERLERSYKTELGDGLKLAYKNFMRCRNKQQCVVELNA